MVLIFGVLAMVASGAAGGLLCWQNRDTVVRLRVADHVWSGHLYGVVILGALLACWFLLGASCIHLRIRERRERRRAASAAGPGDATPPPEPAAAGTSPSGSPVTGRSAGGPPARPPQRRTRPRMGAIGTPR